jgi:hypothetical protein
MKIQRSLTFLFLSIILDFSCNPEPLKVFPQKKSIYTILDSINDLNDKSIRYDVHYFPNFKSEYHNIIKPLDVDSMIISEYGLLYVGIGMNWYKYPSKEYYDTIGSRINHDFLKGKLGLEEIYKFKNQTLKIIVDTSQLISPRVNIHHFSGDAYPVYIINQTNHWVIQEIDLFFPIIMEAKNKEGEWNPIEYKIENNHLGLYHSLPPSSYFVTSAWKFKGNFQTKFRLKFKQQGNFTYSNEFFGSMNLSQFEIPELPRTNTLGKKNYSIFLE